MSFKLKIVVGISVIVAILAIITVVIILMFGNNKTDLLPDNSQSSVNDLVSAVKELPDSKALEFICTELNGYWTFEPNQFFAFITKDGKQFIEYGLYATSYFAIGEITDSRNLGDYEMALTIYVPAQPATEMEEASPERTEIIYIDISHFNLDGRINVKIESFCDGEWHTYNYGGDNIEDAYSNG